VVKRNTHTYIDREREFCVKENESDTESGNRKMLKRMKKRECVKRREYVIKREREYVR
jgi:hypothetical protein